MTDYKDHFEEEYRKFRDSMRKPNILLMGATGTGKSTLVNLIVGEELAKTGAGRPVTQGLHTYQHDLLNILDSEGYESGEENQRRYNENIIGYIDRASTPKDKVHLVWYCVSLPSARFTDLDVSIINQIKAYQVPVALMLTKVDSASEEKAAKMIREISTRCRGLAVFETSTDQDLGRQLDFVEAVINWSLEHLDEAGRTAFISSTRAGLEAKSACGDSYVLQHAAIAATVGASPIPGSDAALLAPNQLAMLARLASVWNLSALDKVSAGGLWPLLASMAGKMVAGNLIKLIPGAGSVAGGVINASVAGAITYGLGKAVNQQCHKYARKILNGEDASFADFFDFNTLAPIIEMFFKEKK